MPLIELVFFVEYTLLSSLIMKKQGSDLSVMVTVLTH